MGGAAPASRSAGSQGRGQAGPGRARARGRVEAESFGRFSAVYDRASKRASQIRSGAYPANAAPRGSATDDGSPIPVRLRTSYFSRPGADPLGLAKHRLL